MEFMYQKNDNAKLFKSVLGANSINVLCPQNYTPIYENFFTLSQKNHNIINLNNKNRVLEVKHKITNNTFLCAVEDNGEKDIELFFKYSPLIDPAKYLIGKYDITDGKLLQLPSFDTNTASDKAKDPNNSAYVDGFFTYLTSKLLHAHKFIHAIDFYGSFLANKIDFECNIADDIEYLNDSAFFHKNKGTLFKIENDFANQMFNFDTRQNKERIKMNTLQDNAGILELSNISDLHELDTMFKTSIEITESKNPLDLLFSYDLSGNIITDEGSSDCSSRSSITELDDENMDIESGSETNSDGSTATEDIMIATIPSFPVNVISMEKCYSTLDKLIVEKGEKMRDDEWGSMMIQVIMMLLAYQKTYNLTHNDLHTNNIMYVKTDEKFLYYKAIDSYYKVPTFGRIYKIIDFGRAIYSFRGNVICSDSYHPGGDAATQYNFEPYFNKNKPLVGPNYSFDLCRLGCSLIDFIDDELNGDKALDAKRIIQEWCEDDKGRNVLYKKNGEERYPNFKLYKMIARTVHNHTPEHELNKKYFSKFRVSKKKLDKNIVIMNIDELPSYIA